MIKKLRRSTFPPVILYFSKIQHHILDNLQNNNAGLLLLTALAEITTPHMYSIH